MRLTFRTGFSAASSFWAISGLGLRGILDFLETSSDTGSTVSGISLGSSVLDDMSFNLLLIGFF